MHALQDSTSCNWRSNGHDSRTQPRAQCRHCRKLLLLSRLMMTDQPTCRVKVSANARPSSSLNHPLTELHAVQERAPSALRLPRPPYAQVVPRRPSRAAARRLLVQHTAPRRLAASRLTVAPSRPPFARLQLPSRTPAALANCAHTRHRSRRTSPAQPARRYHPTLALASESFLASVPRLRSRLTSYTPRLPLTHINKAAYTAGSPKLCAGSSQTYSLAVHVTVALCQAPRGLQPTE